ncbi:16S rRNA (guanine(527)-N(7))-methyltransferase RsmG [Micromonospora sp. NPDC050397]|uniref:16S rRNA (guanine(527)-N(7))-methyltransferase RsmG n=1 Tax=Micromonospora sp. NPDC050397 TaxID=3364279 RepID=UPI00385123D7
MTYDPAARAAAGPGGVTPPGPPAFPDRPDSDDASSNDVSSSAGGELPTSAGPAGTGGTVDRALVPLPAELTDAAQTLFGERLDLAVAYAELLATDGVVRGLIGPREAPRIWERHLLNCAAVTELIPVGRSVVDVGSGAGLPGIVLAIARPDLSVTLVEPLARRTAFLTEAVSALGLESSVTVLRARAEEVAGGGIGGDLALADVVTARAVAPLDRLAGWCLPLAAPGGRVLAMKGSSAGEEIVDHAVAVARLGGGHPVLHQCGVGLLDPATTVVEIVRERAVGPSGSRTARSTRRAATRTEPDRRGAGRARRR